MNIAMILEMAADALGDRLAFGSRDDGLTYERAAQRRPRRRRPGRRHGRRAPRAHGAQRPDRARRALRRRLGGRQLRAAQLPAARRVARASCSPGSSRRSSPRRTGSTPRTASDRAFPDVARAARGAPLHQRHVGRARRPRCSSTTSSSPTCSTRSSSRRRGEDEAAHRVVPPFHIAGVAAVLSSTYVGRRIVPLPGVRFSAEDWLVTARDEQVTHAMLVPTMLARIVEAMEADPSAARPEPAGLVVRRRPHARAGPRAGAAPLPRDRLRQRLRAHRDEQHRRAPRPRRPPPRALQRRAAVQGPPRRRSASRCRASRSASSTTRATTVGPDEPGEIQIRGDQVSGKYVGTDSKTDADGWLHTGDRGWLDVEGYLFCEGRADDTIIRGGENIGPAEIEDALLQHDAISVAAVVGLADEEWGERIAAMVSLRAGRRGDRHRPRARVGPRARSARSRPPSWSTIADEVPQTATGKILRRQVQRRPRAARDGRPLRRQLERQRSSVAERRAARRRRWRSRSSRSGWPLRVPSRKATVIVLTSSNAGSPGCVYGGTWLESQADHPARRGEVVAVPLRSSAGTGRTRRWSP